MADKGSQIELTLSRMPDGGYMVMGPFFISRDARTFLFASTKIDEALAYLKDQIEPVLPVQGPAKS